MPLHTERGVEVIFVVLLGLAAIPLLTIGLLLMIGLFAPNVRRRGLRQLRQPFRLRSGVVSEFTLQKQRRHFEDEIVRRFGKPQ